MEQDLERLREVFIDVFEDDEIEISRATTAADIDEWDSLMHVTLVLEVEKSFGLRFSSGDVADLQDVGGLLDMIEAKSKT